MDLNTITVTDFKGLFRRDFPYLPVWDSTVTYNDGNKVYYNGLFYEAKADGLANVVPTTIASWNKVADDQNNYILDDDINKAFAEAQLLFNQAFFGTDAQIKMGYLYLTAHYLANDIRTALQGVQSVGSQLVTGRTVGSITESYAIPQEYLDDPVLSFYTTTGYGLKYLSMVLPNIRGNVGVVAGWTLP